MGPELICQTFNFARHYYAYIYIHYAHEHHISHSVVDIIKEKKL